jgi:hypothetical protein
MSGKVPVIGAISRKGNVVCKAIENTRRETLNDFVKATVSEEVTLLATDEHQLPSRDGPVRAFDFTRVFRFFLAHSGLMCYNRAVEKSPAKPETKTERADREARERLEHADMDLFDRFFDKLVAIPKEEIDKAVAPPKRRR